MLKKNRIFIRLLLIFFWCMAITLALNAIVGGTGTFLRDGNTIVRFGDGEYKTMGIWYHYVLLLLFSIGFLSAFAAIFHYIIFGRKIKALKYRELVIETIKNNPIYHKTTIFLQYILLISLFIIIVRQIFAI